uniref:Secreted protein n=1 Tax=Bursaphelenchus xylophilus TaxID=6326 RepID=A0A1I7SPH0_BURXY
MNWSRLGFTAPALRSWPPRIVRNAVSRSGKAFRAAEPTPMEPAKKNRRLQNSPRRAMRNSSHLWLAQKAKVRSV